MISIGLKVSGHDTGVGIFIKTSDKFKIYNLLEERFNRDKNTYNFPKLSILKALEITGLKSLYEADLITCEYSSINSSTEKSLLKENGYILDKFKKFEFISHHLCHASNVFLFSNYENSLVLIQDAKGSRVDQKEVKKKIGYSRYFHNKILNLGKKIKYSEGLTIYKAKRNQFEISPIYSKIVCSSKNIGPKNSDVPYYLARYFCGFGQFGAGKVMGLASYGNIKPKFLFNNLIKKDGLDLDFQKMHQKYMYFQNKKSFNKFNEINALKSSDEAKISAEAQFLLEESMLYFAKILKERYPEYENYCLSGGSALNLSANRKVFDSGYFKNVFVAPSSDDSGIALGASIFGMLNILKQDVKNMNFFGSYLGAELSTEILSNSIKTNGFKYDDEDLLIKKMTNLLINEKVIGICKGRSENGPRALGHRSIICLPNKNSQKDRVNKKIKKREWWRPFSPICIEEDVGNYFDLPIKNPYMLFTSQALKITKELCPAIVHYDGTARVQTLSKEQEPFIYKLLLSLKKNGFPPIILNTSFNRAGEPIVETAKDAYNCYNETEIDNLLIETTLFSKS